MSKKQKCKDCCKFNTSNCAYPFCTTEDSVICGCFETISNKAYQQNITIENAEMRMPKTMHFVY